MSKILDGRTRASLLRLGLADGWKCLELGGGNGSVTEWLCEQVGDSGSVMSVELDPRLVELVDAPNLTVRQGDVRTCDLPAEAFDLVMCRALLHQVADYAQDVLVKMGKALRPGGWLFVCEPDFDLVQTCDPPVWRAAWDGIIKWGRTQGVDWFVGRRLPALVQQLGFGHPDAITEVPNIRGTTRDALYFQLFFKIVRDRVLEAGFVDAATFDAACAVLADPDRWTQCWMLTSVWIRRPP